MLTIFGASGDLTQRKLFPALYALAVRHLLPDRFAVVGVARSEMTTEEFRAKMREAVQEHCRDDWDEDVWDQLAAGIRYMQADFDDDASWERLGELLDDLDQERGTRGNRVFYLAVPPSVFEEIVEHVGNRRGAGWTRIVVEKPFGHDLDDRAPR